MRHGAGNQQDAYRNVARRSLRVNGYYPDFSLGIVIGLLLGVFVSAILWAILYHQVQQIRHGGNYGADPLAAAWVAQTRKGEEP